MEESSNYLGLDVISHKRFRKQYFSHFDLLSFPLGQYLVCALAYNRQQHLLDGVGYDSARVESSGVANLWFE